ncbi:MAG TPA: clostripain-related cysteine peptidase [Bacteroidales bacterium]|nr:clostripain-related cysteine peptidase [Bacteroidales bacterium]HNS47702.1 clostripain-related cysteine peptidase [Bacteroidales bacterium]
MKTKLFFALLCPVLMLSSCQKDDEPTTANREWTVIGYFNGNNNLDHTQAGTSYIIGDVQEMEHAGCSDQVTSIVMLSSLKTGGNANYYKIEIGENQLPDQVKSPMLEDLGSKDMSDPQTLINFIKYAVDNYPAKKYMLILNSHGGGWYGISPDEANGSGDMMSLQNLRTALASGPHFDVIVFHACLMSMTEVAFEIKDLADYMVSSEISMPALSVLGGDIWLKELIDNPTMTSLDLSKRIVQCVYDNGALAQKTTHMAVTDLKKMDLLGAKIANLGNKLTTEVTQETWAEVFEAWSETHYINESFPSFTDLREFIKKLQQKPGLSQVNLITQACSEALSAFNETVPFTKNYLQNSSQPYGGLTIHFPNKVEQFDEAKYTDLKFKDTNWYNFLKIFIENTQGGGGQVGDTEVGISGAVTFPGHTLSGHTYVYVYTVSGTEVTLLGYINTQADGTYEALIQGITQATDFAFEAFDDANNDQSLSYGEGYGFWDLNGNSVWDDILNAQPGNAYNNINVVLAPFNGKAAQKDGPLLSTDGNYLNSVPTQRQIPNISN